MDFTGKQIWPIVSELQNVYVYVMFSGDNASKQHYNSYGPNI